MGFVSVIVFLFVSEWKLDDPRLSGQADCLNHHHSMPSSAMWNHYPAVSLVSSSNYSVGSMANDPTGKQDPNNLHRPATPQTSPALLIFDRYTYACSRHHLQCTEENVLVWFSHDCFMLHATDLNWDVFTRSARERLLSDLCFLINPFRPENSLEYLLFRFHCFSWLFVR